MFKKISKLFVYMLILFSCAVGTSIQAKAYPTGTTPLYRYWNGVDHFYTTNWDELGSGKSGYTLEGTQCYVYASPESGTTPLYRYKTNRNYNFYTTNFQELGAGKSGFSLTGIECYVYPN